MKIHSQDCKAGVRHYFAFLPSTRTGHSSWVGNVYQEPWQHFQMLLWSFLELREINFGN